MEQLCDEDREDGEREEAAHLCPPPPCWPAQGGAPALTREGGQTVVLSLASGRPAPHNDPFIRLSEPRPGVSSDKGGRPASCPLSRGVRRGESYLSWTKGHEKWRPQGSQLKPLHCPRGRQAPGGLGTGAGSTSLGLWGTWPGRRRQGQGTRLARPVATMSPGEPNAETNDVTAGPQKLSPFLGSSSPQGASASCLDAR